MQRNLAETILGAAVILVAVAFLLFFNRTVDTGNSSSGYTLTAAFNKVDGLEAGSPVRVSGITVGKVIGMKLNAETFQAEVELQINEDVKLPVDTAAVIASAGLLDGKFMTLEPGGDDVMLEPGARIEYTQSTPSLEQLLGQVIFSLTSDKDKKSGGSDASGAPVLPSAPASVSLPERP